MSFDGPCGFGGVSSEQSGAEVADRLEQAEPGADRGVVGLDE